MPDNDKLEEDYLNDLLNSILTSEEMTDEDIQEFGPLAEEPIEEAQGEDNLESNNENDNLVASEEEEQLTIDNIEENQEESSSVSEEYLMNLFDDSLALDENNETDSDEDSLMIPEEVSEELSIESMEDSAQPEPNNTNMDAVAVKEFEPKEEPVQTSGNTQEVIAEEEPKKKKGNFLSALLGKFKKSKDKAEDKEEKEKSATEEQTVVKESETKEEEIPKKKSKKEKKQKGKGKKVDNAEGSEETEGKSKNKKDKKKSKKDKNKEKGKEKAQEKEEVIKISFKGLLFIITFIVIVILVVKIGGSLFAYNQNMNKATEYFLDKNYNQAYNLVSGLELKDSDEDVYNQLRTIMLVYQEYVSSENFKKMDMNPEALDALIIGVSNYDTYKASADELGVLPDFDYSLGLITGKLKEEYNLSVEEARALGAIKDRTEYSKEIYAVVNK